MTASPVPNPTGAWDFLKTLWPDTSELILSIQPEGGEPFGQRYTVDQRDEFIANLPSANGRLDTYFSVNLPHNAMNKKPRKADIGTIRAVFVDLDPAKDPETDHPMPGEGERIKAETTDEALVAKGLPLPTVRIYSGGGCWLYWVLAEPISVPKWENQTDKPYDKCKSSELVMPEIVRQVDGIGRRIASLFDHGDSCFNIDRIARLPGTVNWASLNPKKPGRADAVATVDFIDTARRYRLEDFPEPLYETTKAAAKPVAAEPPAEPDTSVTLGDLPTEEMQRVAEHGRDPEDVTRWTHKGKRAGSLDKSKMLLWFFCECIRRGVSQSKALGFALGNFGIADAFKNKGKSPRDYAYDQWVKAQAAEAMRPRSGGRGGAGFVCDERGTPIAQNQTNIRLGMDRMGITIWKNEFDDRIYVDGLEGFRPYLDDESANRLRLRLDSEFGFLPTKELFDSVTLDIAVDNRRNPVAEYLDEAQAKWDGTPRLDRVLIDYFGAEDTELHRAIGPIVFMAAVRRVRKPGCKFDEILILESETQGLNKSSAWRALAVNDRWFTDDLPLGARTKEVLEVVEGAWIVELAELRGMRKNEVEAIKAFASRQEDRARKAYGRYTTFLPRRFILVGSTNDRKYLKDRTGNRRFWPVTVGTIDMDRIKADRDQLWAEAATREAAGESIRLAPSLWAEAAKVQEDRAEEHPFDEALGDLMGDIERGWVWTDDLWRVLGKPLPAHRTQADNEALGGAVRRLGWRRPGKRKQIHHGGREQSGYLKGPEGATPGSLPRVTFDRVLGGDNSHDHWRVVVEGSLAADLEREGLTGDAYQNGGQA